MTATDAMIRRNTSTPESREFWARAEEARKEIARWPAWKRVAMSAVDAPGLDSTDVDRAGRIETP